MKTYVYSKGAGDIAVTAPLNLNTGEEITALTFGPVNPTSVDAPSIIISSALMNPVTLEITGGATGVTYGWPLQVTTNQRIFVVMVALTVVSDALAPYLSADPNSYQDLIGELQAGQAALGTAMFQLPGTSDPSQGYVTWDLLDGESTIYASGNAYSYTIRSTPNGSVVIAKAVISVPSNIPQSLNEGYQLRYTLTLQDGGVAYSYENIRVTGFPEMALGTGDSLEMAGDAATMQLVTERLYPNYVVELYKDGSVLASMPVGDPTRVSSGYFVAAVLDTSQLPVQVEPYQVVWKYWTHSAQIMRESAALWLVNDSIISAIEDVKSKINKARQTLYGTPDSQYPATEIMKWLRRGRDMFNGAYGQFTNFSMTNAKGVVREFWLLCAEKAALESQYMLEGEKAFQYQGANISLDVDRTSALDGMISKIQQQLDAELKPIKQNLIIKGHTSGTGAGPNNDGNFSAAGRGATGAVGITLTPASIYGNLFTAFRRF